MTMRHTHCSYCGSPYPSAMAWPRVCVSCGETTWRNPLPVSVAMLPVHSGTAAGLLVIQRNIEPAKGGLALPGGFIDYGEDWREGVVRELREETRIEADARDVRLFAVHSSVSSINIFGLLPPRTLGELPPSAPTDETEGWLVIDRPVPLPFSTHARAVSDYFAST